MAAACPPISATPSVAPSVSGQDTQAYGPDVTKNPQLVLVGTTLEVDSTLTYRNDPSLRMWYKKYNAWNDAIEKLNVLKAAKQWTLPEIGRTELINLLLEGHIGILISKGDLQIFTTTSPWSGG